MSEYQEFTGKTVEEALKNAREEFGVGGLQDLDFEILTQGSRGVLGMGAEPARIIAAPRSALGGAAPKKEAAATAPPPRPAERPARRSGPRQKLAGRSRVARGASRSHAGAASERDAGDVAAGERQPFARGLQGQRCRRHRRGRGRRGRRLVGQGRASTGRRGLARGARGRQGDPRAARRDDGLRRQRGGHRPAPPPRSPSTAPTRRRRKPSARSSAARASASRPCSTSST